MLTNNELIAQMPGLKKFAYKLTGNQAKSEDLLQATLLRAMEKRHLFNDGSSVFSWASKIMYNQFVNEWRSTARYESKYDPEPVIASAAQAADYETKYQLEQVGRAIEQIPDVYRTVLMMVCVHCQSYEDVAAKLGIPVGTVRSRLSRAREALRAALHMHENDDISMHHFMPAHTAYNGGSQMMAA